MHDKCVNNSPTDISLSSSSVNQSGGVNAVVGSLSTTDADGSDVHTYTLVAGTGDTNNGSFNISGNSLRANDASALAAGSYSVRIQTHDGADSFQKAFTLTVVDDIAPTFQNATPSVSGTTPTQTTLTVRLDEIGTAYYVVLPDGATAPSASNVKNGTDSSGTPAPQSGPINVTSAGTDFSTNITGLSPATAYDIYVVAEDDEITPNLGSSTMVDLTTASPDVDGDVTAAGGVAEPVSLSTTVDTVGEAVNLFDFTLSDGGTADALPMTVSQIVVHVSGTASDTDRNKVTWRLGGPDASNVTGTYNGGSDTITFTGLGISVADGAAETYTVNGYYNDNTGLTEDLTFILSIDGDTDLTVGGSGTQMGATFAVNNGSGTTVDVVATQLAFTTQPAGSVSGAALTTQPVVSAQDAFGNTDMDFANSVSLSEASAGALSGTTSLAATAGVATFTDVVYTASADQENFTLTASATGVTDATANLLTSDVVATKLIYTTQPVPTTLIDGVATVFSTSPVATAVDANDLADTGYATAITLSEVNGPGSATMTATGDIDGNGATVSKIPTAGTATFTGLNLTYTLAGTASEIFNLRASSGPLATADSVNLTVSGLPSISIATYDASTGLFVVTGTGMTAGDTIDVSKLTLTGQGGVNYTLTSANVTASSATTFSVTLNFADKIAVDALLNQDGTQSIGGTTYNLAAADDWDINVSLGDSTDATNGITVSNAGNHDTDGVPNAVEDAVSNPVGGGTGDGNGDGINDRRQGNVTSFAATTGDMVTLATDEPSLPLSNIQALPEPLDPPPGVSFPFGMLSFTVAGLAPGATVNITLYVPYNSAIQGYFKKDQLGQWRDIATSVVQVGNKTQIVFPLTEGGPFDFDSDSTTITDPGGAGIRADDGSDNGTDDGSDNGTGNGPDNRPVSIPTIGNIGLALLSGLMALSALVGLHRKSVNQR